MSDFAAGALFGVGVSCIAVQVGVLLWTKPWRKL